MAAPSTLRVQSLKLQGPVFDKLVDPLQQGRAAEIPRQLLVEGPTGTGKSIGLAAFVKRYMRTYPGVNCVVLRKIKADLSGSFMQMWEEEVLDYSDPDDLWMLYGNRGYLLSHQSRHYYEYPNGSKLWCLGTDNWKRVKSKSYGLVWFMEGTEFEEDHLEGLLTRLRKRRSDPEYLPWRGVICDTNPEHPTHWLNERANRGDIYRITTTLQDNPGYFDRDRGEFTEAGEEYKDILAKLKGHNYGRYVAGEWVAAEGQILDWDAKRQTFTGRIVRRPGQRDRLEFPMTHRVLGDFVELKGYAASYDWGKRHAGCLQVWGIDDEERMYLVEEVYHAERPLHWWAEWVVKFHKEYELRVVVCDNAAADSISHFNRELMRKAGAKTTIAVPCDKRSGNRQQSNLEVLQELFSDDLDGKPFVFFKEDALAHGPDQTLSIKRTVDEIPGYVYAPYEPGRNKGRPEERPDPACVDDGLDAMTYMRVYLLGGRSVAEKVNQVDPELNPHEAMREEYWRRRAQRKVRA